MKLTQLVLILGLILASVSCGSESSDSVEDASTRDAPAPDSVTADARTADLASTDRQNADSAVTDSFISDRASVDAAGEDSAAPDGRTTDASLADATNADTATTDNRTIDTPIADMGTATDVSTADAPDADSPDSADAPSSDGAAGDVIDADVAADVPSYAVSVTLAGTGSGTVSSTPAGISCGATCSASYPPGTLVTLDATPSAGSSFTGWSGGGCAGTGACQIAVSDVTDVTATFALNQYALTVNPAGTGAGTVTSSPAAIDCGATCVASFDYGQSVTLTAAASAHSSFTGWSGVAGCPGTGPCTVSMTAARTVTATFTLEQHLLTVIKAGTGAGTVTSNPAGLNCGATCAVNFDYGQDVILTAANSAGSTFDGWSGSGCMGTGPCTISMTAANSVTATFTITQRTLSVSTSGTGMGTVSSNPAGIDCGATCSALFNYGTIVSLYATSSTSAFMGWSGACAGTGACSITMNSSRSVSATFVPPLTCTTVANASICTNGALPQINAGMIAGPACHDQCQIRMKQAGMTTGCWIFASDGNCYCRSGSLSTGGSRPGGSCN